MLFYYPGADVENIIGSSLNLLDDDLAYTSTPFTLEARELYYDNLRALLNWGEGALTSEHTALRKAIRDGFTKLIVEIARKSITAGRGGVWINVKDSEPARKATWTADTVLEIFEVIEGPTHYQRFRGPLIKPSDRAEYLKLTSPRATFVRNAPDWGVVVVKLDVAQLSTVEKRFLRDELEEQRIEIGDHEPIGVRWGDAYTASVLQMDLETGATSRATFRREDMIRITMSNPHSDANIEARVKTLRENWRNDVLAGRRSALQAERDEAERKLQVRQAATDRYRKHRNGRAKFSSDLHIDSLPIQNRGTKASRRWGIEIETGAGRDLSGTPSGWESKGDGSLTSAYSSRYVDPSDCEYAVDHEEPPTVEVYEREVYSPEKGWYTETADEENHGEPWEIDNEDYIDPDECDHCGEVDTDWDDYDDEDCVELVSPILTSFHSNGLKQITDDLEHAPVTHSAGVHVHVEAKDLTVQQVRSLVLAYDHLEPLIEASYRREERGYCKRRSPEELLQIVRLVADAPPSRLRDIPTGDRYVTVNLQALAAHGTIEFRAMGPVYNYDTLVRWAMFCREMVNTVKNGATAKEWNRVKDWAGVEAMFAKYGVEYARATKLETAPRVRTLAQV